MKVQLNYRKGQNKEGFRILKRFSNLKEARDYLQEYTKGLPNFKPGVEPDTLYDSENNILIWISRQFTSTGYYTYPRDKQRKN